MRRFLPTLIFLLVARSACAHPMPNSAVVLRLQHASIDAELTLPITELATGWEKPLSMDAAETVRLYGEDLKDYVLQHVRAIAPDGRPWAVTVRELIAVQEKEPDVRVMLTMTPPSGAPADRLTLRYDAIFHHLITHTALVTLAGDWRKGVTNENPVILGTMRDTNSELVIDRSGGSSLQGFAAMFRLGMRHIAEGTDHLLFLLALLLPAPLVAAGGRWGGYVGGKVAVRRIVKVVTAFTIGHSITLVLGALGWTRAPEAFIESVIAISILVSAIHALFPIFRGRETFIAGVFGLVHGLAFAATLADFGLDSWTLSLSVLGFNLGIEAFQLFVLLMAMPWIVLLAQTRAYRPFRIVGALLTGVAAAAWFATRAFGLANPISTLVDGAAAQAPWLLTSLAVLSCIAYASMRFNRDGARSTERSGSRLSAPSSASTLARPSAPLESASPVICTPTSSS